MSDDLKRLMEQDFENTAASSVDKIDQQGLTSVAALARTIRDKEERISFLEQSLKEEKKTLTDKAGLNIKSKKTMHEPKLAEVGAKHSEDHGSLISESKSNIGEKALVI